MPAVALVVGRRYLIVMPRPLPAAALILHRSFLIDMPMPMPEAPSWYLVVVPSW